MVHHNSDANSTGYNLLISKLDKFIRKYYINQFLRGTLITVGVCVALFIVYALIEHQFYLSQGGRKILLGSYVMILLGTLGYFVFAPLLKYFRLGETISHEGAAKILGDHFPEMNDKLLNVLQLKKNSSVADNSLLIASINQKADEIKLIPFAHAINLTENKKYLKYALPPVLALVFLLFAAPSLVTDSTYRIINNNETFEKEAPFHFTFTNDDFEVVQYDDFRLNIKVVGDQLPAEAYINVDGYEHRLNQQSPTEYTYLFSNVREDVDFQVYSGKYSTEENSITVLPKPKMIDLKVNLDYPRYTGRKDEILLNTGDLSLPEGTVASWTIDTKSTDEVRLTFDQTNKNLLKKGSASFEFSKRLRNDTDYSLTMKNERVPHGDSLSYYINVIKDQHPQIIVEAITDSIESNIVYLVGNASDDYGIKKLNFVFEKINGQGNIIEQSSKPINIQINNQVDYDHILNIEEYKLGPGEKLNYYFEVWDNDGVNGSKSAKTSVMAFQKKSLEELELEEEANEKLIKDNLKDGIDESKKIREDLQKLRDKLLQKKQPDWQDKKELEKLLKRQENLQKNLQQMKDAGAENLKNQNENESLTPEQLQKQERMQELMEETQNDEMQELMEKIQEMMQEMNKEQTIEMTEQFEMNQEQLENQMERLEELYKQLEVEKEIDESVEQLEELAEKLEKLSEETKNEEKSNESLSKEQEEINKEFDELKEKIKDALEKNDELEKPLPAQQDLPEQMDDAGDDLQDSQESIDQEQNENASKSQKSAAQKMKKMAGSMKGQMESGQADQMSEDIETLRQLLENLVTLSFDQEGLVNNINASVVNTPRYVSLLQDQMKIKDDFQVVQDTLNALAKRQPDIETYVLDKVGEVKLYLKTSLRQLEDRKKPEANQSQRFTMKNLNDLALMLSESLEQMQKQMSGMMSGSQMCENPGSSNPNGKKGKGNSPSDKISEGQEQMSEELQKMMKENGKNGKGNSAKDFAEAAAKQAALRKALQDLAKERQEQGQGVSDELQKIIDEMNKQEIDLVNKRLDNDMLKRQQEILTRLLEAESAQKEREMDKKRKSEIGQDAKREYPPSIEEYIKKRKASLEQYKYTSPEVNPHYKRLVDHYYKKLKRT